MVCTVFVHRVHFSTLYGSGFLGLMAFLFTVTISVIRGLKMAKWIDDPEIKVH